MKKKIAITVLILVALGLLVWDTATLKRKTFFIDTEGVETWCWTNDFMDKWAGSNWCGLDDYRYKVAKNVGVKTGRLYEWKQMDNDNWFPILLEQPPEFWSGYGEKIEK